MNTLTYLKPNMPPPDVPHRSIVVWPEHEDLHLGNVRNESVDEHRSKGAALAVCRLIERHGFGGGGKIFPVSTRVEPIE